jgi:hypothetical protein
MIYGVFEGTMSLLQLFGCSPITKNFSPHTYGVRFATLEALFL